MKTTTKTTLRRPAKLPTPPKHLSAEAKRLWNAIHADADISDAAGLLILQSALEAHDRMKQAQASIEKNGVVFTDKFGQPRANPAAVIERDARSAMLAALKALRIDEIDPSLTRGR